MVTIALGDKKSILVYSLILLDEIEKRMAKATIKASDIFSDDEDDNEVEEQPPQETEDLDIEEDVDMQDLQEAEPSAQNEKQKDKLSPSESTTSAPVGKARRKVLKKKTTKNARGFLGKCLRVAVISV